MPQKVLYIITKGNFGGAQRYVYDLARAAQENGAVVSVAIGGSPGLLHEVLKKATVRVIPLLELKNEATGKAIVSTYRTLRELLKQERPDVVHLNSSLAGLSGALAARSCGIPRIIFTAHGWAFNEDRSFIQRSILYVLHYLTVILSHTTICVSNAVRNDISWLPFIQKKLVVIPLGLDAPSYKTRADARTQLAPGKENLFWFGMLGELHPTKGVFEAVTAFSQLASRIPDALLVIMGEGHARESLEAHINGCGLSDRIVLAGYVVDGATYLPAYDVFLFPSRTEALGYAAIEAAHAALPVIASRVGGIPEIIDSGTTGLLVPPRNPALLAEAMQTLAANPALRRELGEGLRDSVAKRFSKEAMRVDTFAHYRS